MKDKIPKPSVLPELNGMPMPYLSFDENNEPVVIIPPEYADYVRRIQAQELSIVLNSIDFLKK